jgi:ankyrin repeat protein
MEGCCVCLDECTTLIINSGWPVCNMCFHKMGHRCPLMRMKITTKLLNNFTREFYQYPLPPPVFNMEEFIYSSDKIAYMNQFDKIEIYNSHLLMENDVCALNIDEFKLFAKKCINLDCPGIYGLCLIHRMSWINNLDMVKCLVENGADVNCVSHWGSHPIHEACHNGDEALEVVKFLIANGADVNCADDSGWRPIHIACRKGDRELELVKFLVANGADVNCANIYGKRPIYLARRCGTTELVEFLIANGAT